MIFKSLLTWLIIVLFGMFHIQFQKNLIEPGMGELITHAVGFLILSMVVLAIAVAFIKINDVSKRRSLSLVGLSWVALSVVLIIVDKVWMKNLTISHFPDTLFSVSGFFVTLNLIFLGFSPRLARWLWNVLEEKTQA